MSLQKPLRPYEKIDTFGQFLERDRMVLRFYGQWDDRDAAFGDVKGSRILTRKIYKKTYFDFMKNTPYLLSLSDDAENTEFKS